MPSHRADTPADATTALRTRASAHPPQQRRRDLRASSPVVPPAPRAAASGSSWAASSGLSWLDDARAAVRDDAPAAPVTAALALDPFALLVEQPARRAEPLPSRRALRTAAKGAEAQGAPQPLRAVGEPAPRRASALGLPQVGIAGALGIATIAVPLSGAFAVAPATKPTSNTVATAAAGALQPLPPFPLVARAPLTALDDVRLLPDQTEAAQVPARLLAPRVVLSNRASRSDQRAVLPGCDGHVPDTAGMLNGRLPSSMLCTLWDPRRQLRSDAAVALAKLNLSYRVRFGHDMCFTDAYRSLAEQYRVKAERGAFAARPGTSEHGWGLAVDLCNGVESGPGSAAYGWMRDNAGAFGWFNPKWALNGGGGPYEPWHWEYLRGEKNQSSGD